MNEPANTEEPLHPLEQLRKILEWSRPECAKQAGISASSVQNIERGAAPLSADAAFALEAATGCNAMHLLESSETWRVMKNKHPDMMHIPVKPGSMAAEYFAPKTLQMRPFSAEMYRHYKSQPLRGEDAVKSAQDLNNRIALLLGSLVNQPDRFRRTYRHLALMLNKERELAGVTDAQLDEFASRMGQATQKVMTLAELSKERDLADHPKWKTANLGARFAPETKMQVVIEEFPCWPDLEGIKSDEDYFVPDYALGRRFIWRITLPDGLLLIVPVTRTDVRGLAGKLTEAMTRNIEAIRKAAEEKQSAAPARVASA